MARNVCACGCGELTGDHKAVYKLGHVPLMPIADRLRAKLMETEAGCLEWQGSRNEKGYGRIASGRRGSRIVLAHRTAWEAANGPIPRGLYVCHTCDNPPCCNIDHLFLGTHADNMQDMDRKGRRRAAPRTAACGTRSGYMAHRRKGEDACQPCRDASTAYNREWLAARTAAR